MRTYSDNPIIQAEYAQGFAEGLAEANADHERNIGLALGRAEGEGCAREFTAHVDRLRAEGESPAYIANFATRFVVAYAEGRTMARERIRTILESNEARGRRDMAIYLACDTDLSVDVCRAQLRGVASVHSIAERARETVNFVRPL